MDKKFKCPYCTDGQVTIPGIDKKGNYVTKKKPKRVR